MPIIGICPPSGVGVCINCIIMPNTIPAINPATLPAELFELIIPPYPKSARPALTTRSYTVRSYLFIRSQLIHSLSAQDGLRAFRGNGYTNPGRVGQCLRKYSIETHNLFMGTGESKTV